MPLSIDDIKKYVENNISHFHKQRIEKIKTLKLKQILEMKNDFVSAQKTLLTSNSKLHIRCINGCCYGKNKNANKGAYFKYCGQEFWEFIGGNENVYLDIIEPLGHKAKECNDEYMEQYTQMINKFTKEFANLFCNNDGIIDWKKLVKFNSEK